MKLLVPFGTRPEIVKLAPVVHALQGHGHAVRVVATGQHTDPRLADDFLTDLRLVPDAQWNLPRDEASRVGALLASAYHELATSRPDALVLLGDTHTVPLFALAARRHGVPVVHVEAGLRSFNPRSLEESHRRVGAALASLHLAPTDLAARFLDAEGVDPRRIVVVGNPVTDTLARWGPPRRGVDDRAGVLFTAHRATNVDSIAGIETVVQTVVGLAAAVGPVTFPVHPRTDGRLRATGGRDILESTPGVTIIEPLRYAAMLAAIASARVVVTDSGGLQEEASWFGVPVVVLRESTPRWEGVLAATTVLAGLDASRAIDAALAFSQPGEQRRVDRVPCPYGDGHVSERIADLLDDPAVLDLLRLEEPDLTAGLPALLAG